MVGWVVVVVGWVVVVVGWIVVASGSPQLPRTSENISTKPDKMKIINLSLFTWFLLIFIMPLVEGDLAAILPFALPPYQWITISFPSHSYRAFRQASRVILTM